jgi:hypothetical protein
MGPSETHINVSFNCLKCTKPLSVSCSLRASFKNRVINLDDKNRFSSTLQDSVRDKLVGKKILIYFDNIDSKVVADCYEDELINIVYPPEVATPFLLSLQQPQQPFNQLPPEGAQLFLPLQQPQQPVVLTQPNNNDNNNNNNNFQRNMPLPLAQPETVTLKKSPQPKKMTQAQQEEKEERILIARTSRPYQAQFRKNLILHYFGNGGILFFF